MNRKIGLAITTYTHNYGSFLQSYAMFEMIKKLGYIPEVISINGVQHQIDAARRKYFMRRMFNLNELRSYSTMLKGILMRHVSRSFAEQQRVREAAFNRFRDEYFKFSPVENSWEKIGKMCEGYTAVVVGSDQLWRPANIEGNYYTLNFVPDNVNKVAYAPSFGIPFLPKQQAEKAKHFLPRFNHIAVREERGAEIIMDLTGIEVPVVCDPTLLFTKEEWDKNVGIRIINDDYILCYFLGDNEQYLKFAKRLKEYWNVKLVGIVHIAGYNKNIKTYMDALLST